MRPFTFVEPATVAEAIEALGQNPHPNPLPEGEGTRDGIRLTTAARVIAGGSDLLGELKEGIASYERLVSLARIAALKGIERRADGLRIGALTTLNELEFSDELVGPYQLLAEAARSVATPEIRNQGTLGGNLCQRPRCLYYRNALTPCLKKGGDGCPAVDSPYQAYLSIMGGDGCYAVHPSDLAPPLIALGALAEIEGPSGKQEVTLEDFFTGPDVDVTRETCLEPGEVLTEVVLPPMPSNWRGVFSKGRDRTAGDFAIASVALGYELVDGSIANCRVVLGSASPTPLRIREAEAVLEGQAPSEGIAGRAADAVLAKADPLAHNGFKVDLARALITRAVVRLAATSRTLP